MSLRSLHQAKQSAKKSKFVDDEAEEKKNGVESGSEPESEDEFDYDDDFLAAEGEGDEEEEEEEEEDSSDSSDDFDPEAEGPSEGEEAADPKMQARSAAVKAAKAGRAAAIGAAAGMAAGLAVLTGKTAKKATAPKPDCHMCDKTSTDRCNLASGGCGKPMCGKHECEVPASDGDFVAICRECVDRQMAMSEAKKNKRKAAAVAAASDDDEAEASTSKSAPKKLKKAAESDLAAVATASIGIKGATVRVASKHKPPRAATDDEDDEKKKTAKTEKKRPPQAPAAKSKSKAKSKRPDPNVRRSDETQDQFEKRIERNKRKRESKKKKKEEEAEAAGDDAPAPVAKPKTKTKKDADTPAASSAPSSSKKSSVLLPPPAIPPIAESAGPVSCEIKDGYAIIQGSGIYVRVPNGHKALMPFMSAFMVTGTPVMFNDANTRSGILAATFQDPSMFPVSPETVAPTAAASKTKKAAVPADDTEKALATLGFAKKAVNGDDDGEGKEEAKPAAKKEKKEKKEEKKAEEAKKPKKKDEKKEEKEPEVEAKVEEKPDKKKKQEAAEGKEEKKNAPAATATAAPSKKAAVAETKADPLVTDPKQLVSLLTSIGGSGAITTDTATLEAASKLVAATTATASSSSSSNAPAMSAVARSEYEMLALQFRKVVVDSLTREPSSEEKPTLSAVENLIIGDGFVDRVSSASALLTELKGPPDDETELLIALFIMLIPAARDAFVNGISDTSVGQLVENQLKQALDSNGWVSAFTDYYTKSHLTPPGKIDKRAEFSFYLMMLKGKAQIHDLFEIAKYRTGIPLSSKLAPIRQLERLLALAIPECMAALVNSPRAPAPVAAST